MDRLPSRSARRSRCGLGRREGVIGHSTRIRARTLVDGAVVQGRESLGRYLEDYKIKP
jgi:hypothetical protein